MMRGLSGTKWKLTPGPHHEINTNLSVISTDSSLEKYLLEFPGFRVPGQKIMLVTHGKLIEIETIEEKYF